MNWQTPNPGLKTICDTTLPSMGAQGVTDLQQKHRALLSGPAHFFSTVSTFLKHFPWT